MAKIGDLDAHCGDCNVIYYCGNAGCYMLCRDERFEDIEEEVYNKIADKITEIKMLEPCIGCTRLDCSIYRYSETEYADEECEYFDDSIDYYCEQVADYVEVYLGLGLPLT